jgi:type IV pilus assembly protein PilB
MLCRQLKIGRYHPDRYPLDTDLIAIIPFETAQKYQVAPLRKKGRLLMVAMTDPMDINAMDSIESLTNFELEPVGATAAEMNSLQKSLYAGQSSLGNFMESFEKGPELDYERADKQTTEDVQVDSASATAAQTPAVIRLTNTIFANAVQERASDIHISPQQSGLQVRFRIDGRLQSMPAPPKSMFLPMVARIKILANMDITVSRVPQDGRFTIKMGNAEINVRASTVPTLYGENLVLRLLDTSLGILTLDRLGMSVEDVEKIKQASLKPYGMILSTGPTGSGKTSSLYSIITEINNPEIHIITLEDPVEYKIDNIRQIQLNEKAGMTFAGGLRAILRQDPDVIMVGEIRDAETASIAVRAAQTGHRLLSTVHTNDAAGAVSRLMDMGIEPFLISSVLLVSFAQRLVRTVCPYCKEEYRPPAKALAAWELDRVEKAVFMRGRGCQQCMNTGYKGRTGIFEVLMNDETVQDMILNKVSAQEITRAAVSSGKMRTLKQDAADKITKGLTTLEEAEATVMA